MKLRELFSQRKNWTQGAMARLADGSVSTIEEGASFCLVGGLLKCYPTENQPIAAKIRDRTGLAITCWNDSHTHSDVLQLCTELDI